MRPLATAALLAASLAPPLGASAPDVVRNAHLITEEEFLAAVDENHPASVQLQEAAGLAQAEVMRVRAFADPELGIAREDPAGAAEQLELTVAWQLPRPGRRRLLVAAAEQEVGAAQATATAGRLELRLTLRRSFAEWAVAGAHAARLRGHAGRMAELAERERLRAERGETSGLGARRLALAAAEARGRLAVAEAMALRAQGEARGFDSALPPTTVAALPKLPAAPPGTDAVHPRLAALTAELEAARLARDAADFIADWPRFVAGWQRQEEAEGSVDGPLLGLAWNLPLTSRRRAERGRAATRFETASARLELARRQIETERAGALAAYEHLSAAALAAAAATAGNPRLAEAATTAFRYGEIGLTDLLETLRSALESELAALELHAAALAAHRDLEGAAGRALTPPGPKTNR